VIQPRFVLRTVYPSGIDQPSVPTPVCWRDSPTGDLAGGVNWSEGNAHTCNRNPTHHNARLLDKELYIVEYSPLLQGGSSHVVAASINGSAGSQDVREAK
jgi:hypothetical protein